MRFNPARTYTMVLFSSEQSIFLYLPISPLLLDFLLTQTIAYLTHLLTTAFYCQTVKLYPQSPAHMKELLIELKNVVLFHAAGSGFSFNTYIPPAQQNTPHFPPKHSTI